VDAIRREGISVEKTAVTSRARLGDPLFSVETEKSLRVRTVTDWLGDERIINIEQA
jgi:hypothetical protein